MNCADPGTVAHPLHAGLLQPEDGGNITVNSFSVMAMFGTIPVMK